MYAHSCPNTQDGARLLLRNRILFSHVHAMMEYKTLVTASSIGTRLLFRNTHQACRAIEDSFSSKEPSEEPLVYRAFHRIRFGRHQPSMR